MCFFEVSTIMLSGLRMLKESRWAGQQHFTAAESVKLKLRERMCGDRESPGRLSCSGMQEYSSDIFSFTCVSWAATILVIKAANERPSALMKLMSLRHSQKTGEQRPQQQHHHSFYCCSLLNKRSEVVMMHTL